MTWEYLMLETSTFENPTPLLNKYGAKGWELVSSENPQDSQRMVRLWFKRPATQATPVTEREK